MSKSAAEPFDDAMVDASWKVKEEAFRGKVRKFLEPRLHYLGLSEKQIAKQSLDELNESLTQLDNLLAHPELFFDDSDKTVKVNLILNELGPSEGILIHLHPILLERKSQILERIALLRPREQMADLKEVVVNTVDDLNLRESLLREIEHGAAKASTEADLLQLELRQTDKERENFELLRQERLITLAERRSKMRKSWFERESIASIVGAVLLLGLGIALIVAMFIGTTTSEVVTSGFLLILGYFFGQASGRKDQEEAKN